MTIPMIIANTVQWDFTYSITHTTRQITRDVDVTLGM